MAAYCQRVSQDNQKQIRRRLPSVLQASRSRTGVIVEKLAQIVKEEVGERLPFVRLKQILMAAAQVSGFLTQEEGGYLPALLFESMRPYTREGGYLPALLFESLKTVPQGSGTCLPKNATRWPNGCSCRQVSKRYPGGGGNDFPLLVYCRSSLLAVILSPVRRRRPNAEKHRRR